MRIMCVRCKVNDATTRGTEVPYAGVPLCTGCAAVLAQDKKNEEKGEK